MAEKIYICLWLSTNTEGYFLSSFPYISYLSTLLSRSSNDCTRSSPLPAAGEAWAAFGLLTALLEALLACVRASSLSLAVKAFSGLAGVVVLFPGVLEVATEAPPAAVEAAAAGFTVFSGLLGLFGFTGVGLAAAVDTATPASVSVCSSFRLEGGGDKSSLSLDSSLVAMVAPRLSPREGTCNVVIIIIMPL